MGYENDTRMVNNFIPSIYSTKGVVLNRTEKRFRKNRPVSLIGPNAYLKDIHAEIEFEESYKPFANQSPRFPKPLKDEALGPGYYTVGENIGRRVTSWEKKPTSATFLKAPSRAPLRSILLEEKQLKKFQRRLDYLNLYY